MRYYFKLVLYPVGNESCIRMEYGCIFVNCLNNIYFYLPLPIQEKTWLPQKNTKLKFPTFSRKKK